MPSYILSVFLKSIYYLKLSVNNLENMNITNFHDFSKTFGISFFSSTFPGLEITILKFHDFSNIYMSVSVCGYLCVCVCVCVKCVVCVCVCVGGWVCVCVVELVLCVCVCV